MKKRFKTAFAVLLATLMSFMTISTPCSTTNYYSCTHTSPAFELPMPGDSPITPVIPCPDPIFEN